VTAIFAVLYFATLVYLLLLLTRMVLDWVQFFARDWHPSGVGLVVAETVYTVTDPPLKWLRRFLPPVGFGNVRFDLAFLVLTMVIWVLLSVFGRAAGL
jgi:YggT family protein